PSGVVVIKHWRMHNYIKKDRYKETVYTEEKGQLDIKENGSYTEGEQFGYSSDTLWNRFGYSLEPQVRVRDRVRDRVSKENICSELEQSPSIEADDCTKEPSNATSEIPKKEQKHYVTFMQFWSAYPRKVGKGAAEKSWKNLKVDDTLLKTILDAVEAQKKSNQWVRDNGQYIPYPATWLNQKRWEDEVDSTGAVGTKAYGRQKAIGRTSTESGSTISIDDYNTI
ncbi:hypothetical protein, partial [Sphaerochaeta sp.]|uniref:hypothetical protein n=1 Tax=Sphaerochaeta sp. TaxID=1972642 RepID=UPI003D12C795